jgi:hypothetical protein
MLTDVVKKCMSDYGKTLKEKYNIEMDGDIANGFITRALQHHYEKNYFSIVPSNVKVRKSEEELRDKLYVGYAIKAPHRDLLFYLFVAIKSRVTSKLNKRLPNCRS